MPRPVKWSRDVHAIRERAQRSKTETWSRQDIERLFEISRPSAQSLMKAIGEVQVVGGTHFVGRASLLGFLNVVLAAPTVEEGLRLRHEQAAPAPRPSSLRVGLPQDLRSAMMPDLPHNITIEPGRIEVRAATAEAMLEELVTLAMIMQNDLDRFRAAVEVTIPSHEDAELSALLGRMRTS